MADRFDESPAELAERNEVERKLNDIIDATVPMLNDASLMLGQAYGAQAGHYDGLIAQLDLFRMQIDWMSDWLDNAKFEEE